MLKSSLDFGQPLLEFLSGQYLLYLLLKSSSSLSVMEESLTLVLLPLSCLMVFVAFVRSLFSMVISFCKCLVSCWVKAGI